MKTTALAVLTGVLFFTTNCFAAEQGFSWLPSDDEGEIGYRLHYGEVSRAYTTVIDVGSPEPIGGRIIALASNLIPGKKLYFAATAYNDIAVSDYSVELEVIIPLTPPGDIKIELPLPSSINITFN